MRHSLVAAMLSFGCGVTVLAAAPPAIAQDGSGELSKDEAEQQLEQQRKDLATTKEQASGLKLSIDDLNKSRAELSEKLVDTANPHQGEGSAR